MVLGMTLATYTFLHVLISLVGIGSGAIVLVGYLARRHLRRWVAVFLWSTLLTSVTGFGFPFVRLLPSHIFGIISLPVLALAIVALYVYHLVGSWRWIYLVTAMIALYLNVFVLIVQAFLKIPVLNALAPTQSEAPFVAAQGAVLVLFVALSALAVIKFRDVPAGHVRV